MVQGQYYLTVQQTLLFILILLMTVGFIAKTPQEAWAKGKEEAPVSKQDSARVQEETDEATLERGLVKQLRPAARKQLQELTQELQLQNRAIANELADGEEASVADMAMLWQAAVEKSGTIRYAIEKLSRRDATGKPVSNDGFTKRMIQSIARLGGAAGSMVTGTPAGVLGGDMINGLLMEDPVDGLNTPITDADMLILAKSVESLQTQLLEAYFDYRHCRERWQLSRETSTSMGTHYKSARKSTKKSLRPLIESLYDNVRQEEVDAERDYISSRNALGLVVGEGALVALENSLKETAAQ